MKNRDINTFTVFFETQWPRLMELQKIFQRAQIRAGNYHDYWMPERIARKKRLFQHAEKISSHFKWLMKQQFGSDIQWISTWVNRTGPLKDLDKGNGFRGEVLQYILWGKK